MSFASKVPYMIIFFFNFFKDKNVLFLVALIIFRVAYNSLPPLTSGLSRARGSAVQRSKRKKNA